MTVDEYFQKRAVRDPAFRAAQEALRPEYEFRRALIAARLRVGLTQKQLADRIGTTQSAVARLEAGTTEPRFDMLRRLSNALNVSFEIMPSAAIQVHDQDPVQV
jgi:transcriptional regulator with XRE-family HTH domain